MPKPSTHILHWSEKNQLYELLTNGRPEQRFESESGLFWLGWLETHTSFSFRGREGPLSVIKETRPRGTGYWYAYRSLGRSTTKQYLGQASNVTIAHLEEVAGTLAREIRGKRTTPERSEKVASSSSPNTLLLPKLLPPRLPSSLVARPRLLQRLDAALEGKLTLVVAPAGFGKTTIISQWINDRRTRSRPLPMAWVSLDSGDNDLFRFWRAVIVACQMFQQNLGQTALAFLSEALRPPFASPPLERTLTFLLNDIAQQVEDGLLILDDYHTIKESRIHETLTFFLDHLPPTLRVLLLTRAEPTHLPLMRWRARGDLSELHGADLRFSPEETATFLSQVLPSPLSEGALKQLDASQLRESDCKAVHALSEGALKQLDASLQGWIAGLRLLTLSMPGQMTARAVERILVSLGQHSDPSSPYQPLLDYFVTEVLNAQPEALQNFLLQTSMLSRLSGPLCDAVTGEKDSAVQLEAIEQAGLFLEALDGEGEWYRFHALFSEAIRREAMHRLGEEALRAFSLRASRWYEKHAMTTEAIEAALQAQDFERAALLIEQTRTKGQLAELHTVRHWLDPMPEAVLRAYPMLCWLAALAFQMEQKEVSISTADRQRTEGLLHMAEEGWRHQGNLALLGLIAAFHAMSAWRSGQFSHAVEYAQKALAQLADNEQDSSIQIFRGICLFIIATGSMYEGRFDGARSLLLEAYACSLGSGDRHITRSMLLLVGVCSYALGELHQAHEHYQLALSDARKQDDREIITQALLGLANISFQWNNLSEAEQQAHEALVFAREEDADQLNGAAFQFALLAYARGQITSAQQQFAALLARLQVTSTPQAAQMLSNVLAWQARLFLETGELQKALRSLETHDLEEHMSVRIVQARLWLSQGKPHEARVWLERLLSEAIEQRQMHDALEIQILLSLAHAACQEAQEAYHCLRQALSLARSDGFVRPFLSEGESLVRLLRQMVPTLREPELRSYAQTILRAFAMSDETNAPGTVSLDGLLVEQLSPQEQRVLRLLAAGHSNQEIAQALVVSINTVKDHVKHLYRKLGVSNRLQASEAAHQLKLL